MKNRHRAIEIIIRLIVILILPTGAASAALPGEEYSSRDYADGFARISESVFKPLYGPLSEYVVSRYGLAEKEGVGLDIGGGAGNLAAELARRAPKMYWINADINPHFSRYTVRAAEEAGVGSRVGFINADVHELPFRDDYADIIVSRGSFHLWKDKRRAFAEILRVLKPGCPAYIGRGFSENLPVETARTIREKQGGGPKYDVSRTAVELEGIMAALGITEYGIHIPEPPGRGDVNYGIWLEFRKPGGGRRPAPETSDKSAEQPPRKERVYVLEPVEVTGKQARDVIENPLAESPGLEPSISVVERKEILRQGAKTVIEALEYVPGAWIETRGRKVKQFFSTRGQKYPYPEYAVNGALYREFHEIPYFFSSADIERIEVLRSSAAMLSGISGLAGVINIVPRTYTAPETSWEIEYGSFDTYRAHISHGGRVKNVSYSLGLDAPHTDGPAGRHAAERMSNFQGTVAWKPTPTLSFRTSLFHIDGERELARALPPAAKRFRETSERFDPFRTTFLSAETSYRPRETASTNLLLYYADRDHLFHNESEEGHVSTREWDFEWGMNLVQALALSGNNVIRVGGYYNRWVAPNGKRFYVGRKCDLETFSAAVVDEHTFGPLTVDAGVRLAKTYIHEYGAFNINGSAKGFKKVEPVTDEWEPADVSVSLGASYCLDRRVSLHGNIVSGYVRPRKGTLDVNGAEPGDERRVMLDAGVKITDEKFGETSIAGFLTLQNDAIVLSGKTETVNGRTMELYLNRDQYQAGVEFEFKSKPIRDVAGLFLNATAMRSRAEIDGEMRRDGEKPACIAGGGIYGGFSGYDCNLFWKYVSSYESTRFVAGIDGAPPEPQPLGDYITLNLTAGRSFGASLKSRVYVEITNLMDRRYSTVAGYPDFGRRYTVGLRQAF